MSLSSSLSQDLVVEFWRVLLLCINFGWNFSWNWWGWLCSRLGALLRFHWQASLILRLPSPGQDRRHLREPPHPCSRSNLHQTDLRGDRSTRDGWIGVVTRREIGGRQRGANPSSTRSGSRRQDCSGHLLNCTGPWLDFRERGIRAIHESNSPHRLQRTFLCLRIAKRRCFRRRQLCQMDLRGHTAQISPPRRSSSPWILVFLSWTQVCGLILSQSRCQSRCLSQNLTTDLVSREASRWCTWLILGPGFGRGPIRCSVLCVREGESPQPTPGVWVQQTRQKVPVKVFGGAFLLVL